MTSHLMGANIFLVHIAGHDQSLYHRLTVSLRRIIQPDRLRAFFFVAILRSDYAGAGFMLIRSTTESAPALGTGLVGSLKTLFLTKKNK